MGNKKQKIKIIWRDAVIFTESDKIPTSLPLITTIGTVAHKTDKYFLLKNTKSTSNQRKNKLPKDSAKFYFIPVGMVVDIEKI